MKYKLVFPEEISQEHVNEALFDLFGSISSDIEWSDNRTVIVSVGLITITEVKQMS